MLKCGMMSCDQLVVAGPAVKFSAYNLWYVLFFAMYTAFCSSVLAQSLNYHLVQPWSLVVQLPPCLCMKVMMMR